MPQPKNMFNAGFKFIQKVKSLFPFYKTMNYNLFSINFKRFPKETITARFVGGCVRKYLSDDEIDDIDIATILSSNDIKEKFKNTKFKIIDTGIKHELSLNI